MMLLSRGWRLLRYSFFTSISFRIFSLLVRHSLYFSASLGVRIQLPPQLQNLPGPTWGSNSPDLAKVTAGTRRAQRQLQTKSS